MKILSRYLLREHFGPFAFALGALTGLLILNQVARKFGDLIGKGLPWSVILSVFGLSLPFILAMTVPMAVLVAVLHAFSRLGADSEITALKASGVNLVNLVRPVLAAAILLATFELLFLDQVLPRSNHQLKDLLIDIARKKPTFELREQTVNEVVPNQLFLRAGRIDQATDQMRDIVIYDLANPMRRRTIYADSGYIRFNAARTDLFLSLFDGYIHDYDRAQAATFRRIFFKTDLVKVRNVSNQLERTSENEFRGERELSLCEMEAVVVRDFIALELAEQERRGALARDAMALIGAAPARADTSRPVVKRMNLTALYCGILAKLKGGVIPTLRADTVIPPALRQVPQPVSVPAYRQPRPGVPITDRAGQTLKAQVAGVRQREAQILSHAAGYQVEIHKKYSLAVSCIVFVLIGAPVALRFPRGGIGLVIGASVGIFGFYYIGLIGGETLADRMIITPFWSMWLPNIAMAVAGLALFIRLGRETASVRGGGPFTWLRERRRRKRIRTSA